MTALEPDAVVLVPMFNESAVVGDVVRELRTHFASVVCIDDGSVDGSADVARRAGAEVVRHCVNLGQGAALQTGFEHVLRRTAAAHVVTFDADGQHASSDAVAMLHAARARGADVLLGSRNIGSTQEQPLVRRLVLALALRYSRWVTGLPLTDTHNGLRVLSRRAVATLRLQHSGMAYATELEVAIARHGLTWSEHPVCISYTDYSRAKGQSNLNAFNILFDLAARRLGPVA